MITAKTPILCWVTNRSELYVETGQTREGCLLKRIQEAVDAGIDWIELREKNLETPQLLELAELAVAASRNTKTRILLNDRLDIALAVGAHGVHLPESSLPVDRVVQAVRPKAGPNFLVGASCHSFGAVAHAADAGADYVFFGPIFATPSKAAFGKPQGLARLAEVCQATRIPVIAIGGITEANAAACISAGVSGIAAIRLFMRAPRLPELIKTLRI